MDKTIETGATIPNEPFYAEGEDLCAPREIISFCNGYCLLGLHFYPPVTGLNPDPPELQLALVDADQKLVWLSTIQKPADRSAYDELCFLLKILNLAVWVWTTYSIFGKPVRQNHKKPVISNCLVLIVVLI